MFARSLIRFSSFSVNWPGLIHTDGRMSSRVLECRANGSDKENDGGDINIQVMLRKLY